MRHLLEVDDLTPEELVAVLALARRRDLPAVLQRRGVALVFEKPSARTRNSMEMAVVQLGGHPVTIRPDEVGLDVRETVEDVTRTLACYHAVIAARVFQHSHLERMASVSPVPVVNLLSDEAHPMQALADLLTLEDAFGPLSGRTVAYVGDGNNVCRSLAIAAGMMGMQVRVASPPGYELAEADIQRIRAAGVEPQLTTEPLDAVRGADAVYTDVWASMGQEAEAAERRRAFAGFTVDTALLDAASPSAVFLHCLPAHRGEEVTAEVLEGPRSWVWPQAENRMHAARGLLAWLLGVAP
ncbi:ornithine carbamoyltransferase [Rhabdothermincola sp.]|uniref:ornithine carbamoyltransferase n=1 Tax=Rhabdothermincola sp. TaxID=2820405 RepID=UPI002FE190C7